MRLFKINWVAKRGWATGKISETPPYLMRQACRSSRASVDYSKSSTDNTANFTTQPNAHRLLSPPPPSNRPPQTHRTRKANLGHRLNEQQYVSPALIARRSLTCVPPFATWASYLSHTRSRRGWYLDLPPPPLPTDLDTLTSIAASSRTTFRSPLNFSPPDLHASSLLSLTPCTR